MKVRPRTRQLVVALSSLVVLLGAIGLAQSFASPGFAKVSIAPQSSEVGFTSLSPRGTSGGAIVPASCESGLGEGGFPHFAGDTSGSCTMGASFPTVDIKANGSDGPIIVPVNTSATISWASSGAASCTVSPGGWTGLSNSGVSTGPLASSQTYTITCTGPQGLYGSAAESWNCGPRCTAIYNPSDPVYPAGCSGPVDTYPSSATCAPGFTRVLVASGPGGAACADAHAEYFACSGTPTVSDTVTVNVAGARPVPTAVLSANPSTIDQGQSSTLTWSSTNATSCSAVGGFSTGGAASGSASTGPLSSTQNYQIYCDGSGGRGFSNIATVTVRIPTVSISATPDRVRSGDQTTVEWNATNVNACTITRNGVTWQTLTADVSGTVSGSDTSSITGQTTFLISCTNNSNAVATATKTVNVLTDFQEF